MMELVKFHRRSWLCRPVLDLNPRSVSGSDPRPASSQTTSNLPRSTCLQSICLGNKVWPGRQPLAGAAVAAASAPPEARRPEHQPLRFLLGRPGWTSPVQSGWRPSPGSGPPFTPVQAHLWRPVVPMVADGGFREPTMEGRPRAALFHRSLLHRDGVDRLILRPGRLARGWAHRRDHPARLPVSALKWL